MSSLHANHAPGAAGRKPLPQHRPNNRRSSIQVLTGVDMAGVAGHVLHVIGVGSEMAAAAPATGFGGTIVVL
ncbi:MAG: hypothetical protein ACKVWR_07305 [Acidimicrobiales bacterium]